MIFTCFTKEGTNQERAPLISNNLLVQTSDSENSNSDEVTTQTETIVQKIECPICYSNVLESERDQIVFVPCGHFSCDNCAPQVSDCPVCREKIRIKMKIFNNYS